MSIRFEVLINGKRVCVSGHDGFGVLDAILTWCKRDKARYDPVKNANLTSEEWNAEELWLDVGGLDSTRQPEAKQYLRWGRYTLQRGDEVTVRILDNGQFDEPREA